MLGRWQPVGCIRMPHISVGCIAVCRLALGGSISSLQL